MAEISKKFYVYANEKRSFWLPDNKVLNSYGIKSYVD